MAHVSFGGMRLALQQRFPAGSTGSQYVALMKRRSSGESGRPVTSEFAAPQDQSAERIVVGKVLAPWGLRGDMRVEPQTGNAKRFEIGSEILLQGEPRRIERSRRQGGVIILKLVGIERPEDIEPLRGEWLEIPAESVPVLAEDWYYHFQLIGLHVRTEDGRDLGTLAEILETGANDVYVVRGTGKEYLIPAVAEVVQTVDLGAGHLIVRELPGLLD